MMALNMFCYREYLCKLCAVVNLNNKPIKSMGTSIELCRNCGVIDDDHGDGVMILNRALMDEARLSWLKRKFEVIVWYHRLSDRHKMVSCCKIID